MNFININNTMTEDIDVEMQKINTLNNKNKHQSFIPKSFRLDATSKKIGFITRNLLLTFFFGLLYIFILRLNKDTMPIWKVFYFSLITQTTLGYDWMLPSKPIYYGINALHLIILWSMIIFEFVY